MKKYAELSELEQHKIRNHIAHLYAMSSVDGKFSKSEAEAIIRICERYGIKRQDITEIFEDKATFDYTLPSDSCEKLEQMYDFVTVVVADGTIATKELDLCKEMARLLKLPLDNINHLLITMVESIQNNRTFDQVKMNLYAIIHP